MPVLIPPPHRRAEGASRKKITFNVTVKIDKPGEWDEVFDDAWAHS